MITSITFFSFLVFKKTNYMKNLIKFFLKPLNPVDLEFGSP